MGPYPGGQAEYVRVPFADFNALKLPAGKQHEDDFALLADIFPTVRNPSPLSQPRVRPLTDSRWPGVARS